MTSNLVPEDVFEVLPLEIERKVRDEDPELVGDVRLVDSGQWTGNDSAELVTVEVLRLLDVHLAAKPLVLVHLGDGTPSKL